ncbi:MAG TPA: DUF5995 family protein [Kofleriaceae bacterium]|jgi:hypothetical protein|nr:DUF5995 family protein [Kofleriaceae bacterium]
MPDVQTIDEVVAQLDQIIAAAIASRSRIGLFAALYRQVTLKIRRGIADGLFEDGARMARLDAVFANRYLAALSAWQAGGTPSQSWQFAFDATKRDDLVVIQHLLLGINAHINLDLGIAAAAVCPGDALPGLHTDFNRINLILSGMVEGVKRTIAKFSPLTHLLDEVGGSFENGMINFSMAAARDDAWQHAALLAPLDPALIGPTITLIDTKATFLGRLVADPGRMLTRVLDAIHLGESPDVTEIIQALNALVP